MAKVEGPLHSFHASGVFGKTLGFLKTISGNIVKKLPSIIPPASGNQENARTFFIQAKNEWNGLTGPQKQVYNDMAIDQPLTGFNIFMSEKLKDLHKGQENALYGPGVYDFDYYIP